ncbi:GtrA family protein [Variovorax sp. HJSM1_2]|uniref:GtrA family protein n=1 Tax=Variovorax sp. HJSM1_2 TaxID=3366263 RepID=UPI003BBE396D
MTGELFRYLLVGVFNTFFGYALIFGAQFLLNWPPMVSNFAGYSVALMVSFALNRNLTFRSTGKKSKELPRFLLVFALAYLANFIVLYVLLRYTKTPSGACQIIAGVIYIFISYTLNKLLVFTSSVEKNGKK